MTTTNTTTDTTRIPICDAVRIALIDLLTTGQHHDAATTATLRAIGTTRTHLAALHQHNRHNPIARYAQSEDRHAALSSALGDTARALLAEQPFPDITLLRAGLTTLAAVALAWLDTLPHPNPADPDDEDYHDCAEPEPF
jgi:hypothetical protein